jgi:hypothetical protein
MASGCSSHATCGNPAPPGNSDRRLGPLRQYAPSHTSPRDGSKMHPLPPGCIMAPQRPHRVCGAARDGLAQAATRCRHAARGAWRFPESPRDLSVTRSRVPGSTALVRSSSPASRKEQPGRESLPCPAGSTAGSAGVARRDQYRFQSLTEVGLPTKRFMRDAPSWVKGSTALPLWNSPCAQKVSSRCKVPPSSATISQFSR